MIEGIKRAGLFARARYGLPCTVVLGIAALVLLAGASFVLLGVVGLVRAL